MSDRIAIASDQPPYVTGHIGPDDHLTEMSNDPDTQTDSTGPPYIRTESTRQKIRFPGSSRQPTGTDQPYMSQATGPSYVQQRYQEIKYP